MVLVMSDVVDHWPLALSSTTLVEFSSTAYKEQLRRMVAGTLPGTGTLADADNGRFPSAVTAKL